MQPLVNHPGSYREKVIRLLWRSPPADTMTNQPIILLISGWAGSGKDAAAALVAEELGFTRFAFAAALKADAAAETGITLDEFSSHFYKDAPLTEPCYAYPQAATPREVLLAHAARARAANPNIYTESTAADIAAFGGQRAVVSDWRQRCEYEFLVARFPKARVVTLRVTRASVAQRPEDIEHDLDAFPYDIRIANNGSISDLRDALRHALRPHLI